MTLPRATFPIFVLICEHEAHARFMRTMLCLAPQEVIVITTQDRRDSPDGHWKPLRGYDTSTVRWLTIWESYGSYWCCRGDGALEWKTPQMDVEHMLVLIDKHRIEQM